MSKVPVIPETAPFDAAQRLWLNGFLAGLFAHQPSGTESPAPATPATPLLIIFGSQTGTAEGLARRFASEAGRRGFQSRVVDAAAAAAVEWSKESQLLIVTSTYGDGEMPDNAKMFWDWLQTEAGKVLAHLRYAVLALGDSNYEHFCAAGRRIDERLEALGATRACARGECDVDYESVAKPWLETALGAFGTGKPSPSNGTESAAMTAKDRISPAPPEAYSRNKPFPARLLSNRKLTGAGSDKEVRHVEICLEGSGLVYQAGDALGVRPTNCPALVRDLLEVLKCDGEEAVSAPGAEEVSLRKALSDSYDITKPSKELLQAAAADSPTLRDLLGPDRKEDLKRWLWGREVIDILMEAPKFRPPPSDLISLLKPLVPRLYSISSSPKAHAGQVHLTVGIVRHETQGRWRKGVCSTFLADRAEDPVSVPVFVQTSHGFRLPADSEVPIIMVGPGTGVAPFRAFLHERQAIGAKGRNWLFFGEQRAASNFYYRDEFEFMLDSRHLTRLSTAFSRDQADKVYVQNRMLEEGGLLWEWLEGGAHFYVCGDALRMAKDVDAALHSVIETAGGLNREAAQAYVNKMRTDQRYQRDVY
jgi:sulfite reductase (NADPH) flavoprotein alpha-component